MYVDGSIQIGAFRAFDAVHQFITGKYFARIAIQFLHNLKFDMGYIDFNTIYK
ncbi:hypothetical protein D3C74_506540 [compost metagenome]